MIVTNTSKSSPVTVTLASSSIVSVTTVERAETLSVPVGILLAFNTEPETLTVTTINKS